MSGISVGRYESQQRWLAKGDNYERKTEMQRRRTACVKVLCPDIKKSELVKLICPHCGITFGRLKSYVRYQKNIGQKRFFCSITCRAKGGKK